MMVFPVKFIRSASIVALDISLPALRLAGMEESVVEAPLELLSAPAEEAAEEVRKAPMRGR